MKILKASGCIYRENDIIGLNKRGIIIATDAIDKIIGPSSNIYPFLEDYTSYPEQYDSVRGHATLEHRDGGIWATIYFNEPGRKIFEPILCSNIGRDVLRLGFMMYYSNRLYKKHPVITNSYIKCITLSKNNLGGPIESFGWEERE